MSGTIRNKESSARQRNPEYENGPVITDRIPNLISKKFYNNVNINY